MFNLESEFKLFFNNDLIKYYAKKDNAAWTVSNKNKMPINFQKFSSTGKINGAHTHDDQCLATFNEITSFDHDLISKHDIRLANYAMWLDCNRSGFMCLDIEPSAPPNIVDTLLKIGAIYAERSLSGKGYHLFMPLPASYDDYPLAHEKDSLVSGDRFFEILQRHWVTFTKNGIDPSIISRKVDLDAWDKLWSSMAQEVKPSVTFTANLDNVLPLDQVESGVNWIKDKMAPPHVSKAKFSPNHDPNNPDWSRYEYALALKYAKQVKWVTQLNGPKPIPIKDLAWDDLDVVRSVTFYLVKDVLTPRDKHNKIISHQSGLTYLQYTVFKAVECIYNDDEELEDIDTKTVNPKF